MQEQIMKGILQSSGVGSPDEIHVLTEKDISFGSRRRDHQVASVGYKIVSAARGYVEEKLQEEMARVRAKLPQDITDQDAILQLIQEDENVQYWLDARYRLQGEQVENKIWQYVFIESKVPNAFVTEMLPQSFFITTAMLQVAETHDELAVVLGHELSHLVLGHISQRNQVEIFLRTLEILLLTLDPSEGILSVAVVGGLAALHGALAAAHSREHEHEADKLGVELAARACFDTESGVEVMRKMHDMKVSAASPQTEHAAQRHVALQLLDTHPPTLDRWERIKALSKTENYPKYHVQCADVTTKLYRALWGSAGPPKN